MFHECFEQVEQQLNTERQSFLKSESKIDLKSFKNQDSFIKSKIENTHETAPLQSVSFLSSTTKNFCQENRILVDLTNSFLSSSKASSRTRCSYSSQYSSFYEEDEKNISESNEQIISSIFANDLNKRCSRISQLLAQKSIDTNYSNTCMMPLPACSSTPTKKPKTSTPQLKRKNSQNLAECYASTRFDDSCLSSGCSLDWPLVEDTQLFSGNHFCDENEQPSVDQTSKDSFLNQANQQVFTQSKKHSNFVNKSDKVGKFGTSFRSMVVKRCMKPFKRLCNIKIFEF
jgi:hypothetical protein